MNATRLYKLTVIVPVYNEEDNIGALEKRLGEYLKRSLWKCCVLFVNDGSKDNSFEKIKEICSSNNDFYYISFMHNCGLSAAIKAGIDLSESDYVGYIDADLQTDPDDFNLLIPYASDYGMVAGIRAARKDKFGKKLQSRFANRFRKVFTHDGATDTGCPLKILKTSVAKKIPFFTGMHRFLAALVQLQNCKVKEVPVRHYPRTAGLSKYHLWNRLISPFMDCFAYLWMKKRYINYSIREDNIG